MSVAVQPAPIFERNTVGDDSDDAYQEPLMECASIFIDTIGCFYFRCNICNESVDQFNLFKSHLQTHFHDPPFFCHFCDQSFDEFEWLIIHVNARECLLAHQDDIRDNNDDNHPGDQGEDDDTRNSDGNCTSIESNHSLVDGGGSDTDSVKYNKDSVQFYDNLCKLEEIPLIDCETIHLQKLESDVKIEDVNQKTLASESEWEEIDLNSDLWCEIDGMKNSTINNNKSVDSASDTHNGNTPVEINKCNNTATNFEEFLTSFQINLNRNNVEEECETKHETLTSLQEDEEIINGHESDLWEEVPICKNVLPDDGSTKKIPDDDVTEQRRDIKTKRKRGRPKQYSANNRCPPCEVCGKTFASYDYAQRHKLIHTGEKPFECNICGRRFSQKSSVKVHVLSHNRNVKNYGCDICGGKFASQNVLHKHMQRHSDIRPHKCELCGKGFALKSYLTYHMSSHMAEKPHKCNVCQKTFARKNYLKEHMQKKNVHIYQEKEFKCTKCISSFDTELGLKHHLKRHDLIGVQLPTEIHKCPYCCAIFPKVMALRRHTVRKHAISLPKKRGNKTDIMMVYNCSICNGAFSSPWGLNIHMRKKHSLSQIDNVVVTSEVASNIEVATTGSASNKDVMSINGTSDLDVLNLSGSEYGEEEGPDLTGGGIWGAKESFIEASTGELMTK